MASESFQYVSVSNMARGVPGSQAEAQRHRGTEAQRIGRRPQGVVVCLGRHPQDIVAKKIPRPCQEVAREEEKGLGIRD